MKFSNVLIWGAAAVLVLVLFFIQIKSGGFGSSSGKTGGKEITKEINKTMETSKLIIEDEVVGTGDTATAGQSVTVHYVGTLTNGTMFDASRNHGSQGFTFKLGAGEVIQGWDQGVAGMKVGGKRKLTVPPELAYGNQSVGGGLIPANSTLVFEVELLKVGK